MFGLSFSHLVIFGVILLIFVGPEQLPEVARTIGRFLNELRRATHDFQGQFTGQFRDEARTFQDLRQEITSAAAEPPPPAADPASEPHGAVHPPANEEKKS